MTAPQHRWDAPPLPDPDGATAAACGDDLREGWTLRADASRLAAVAHVVAEQDRSVLDGVAREVAADLASPVALVSLVGRDGQEFAGAQGLSGWLDDTRGTPVEWSLCRHVVESGRAMVVEDAAHDDRHRDNPLVQDGVIGSYVGVPLRHHGQLVGALCVISPSARQVGPDEAARLAGHATRLERRFAEQDPAGPTGAGPELLARDHHGTDGT